MIERPKGRQEIPEDAKKVFAGELFDVYQWEQKQYDGTTKTFEKLKRIDTVCVIPVLPDRKLLLIEDEQPGRESVLTFPGGRMDEGESPTDAALRELHEETGYKPGELVFWKAFQPVSKIDWALYFFIARDCVKTGESHVDAGERITLRPMALEALFKLVDDPKFQGDGLRLDLAKAKYNEEERARLEKLLFGN